MLFTVNDELISTVQKENASQDIIVQFQSAMDLFVGKEVKGRRSIKQPIITATLTHEDDWSGECKLHYAKNPKGKFPRVTCKVTDKPDTECNRPVYIVAVPFNGIMDTIKPSSGYRVHRAFIGKAKKRTIPFGGELYKKVVYMVVTPNMNMFKEGSPNYTSSIDMEIVSYNLNTTESGESKTVKSTATVSFTKGGCDFSIVTEDWHAVDPKKLETTRSYIFPLYNGLTDSKKKSGKPKAMKSTPKEKQDHLTQHVDGSKLNDMIDKFNKESDEKRANLRKRADR